MDIKYNKDQMVEYLNENIEKFKKYYNESDFLKKVTEFAKKAGEQTLLVVFELYYALKEGTLSTTDKVLVIAALGYFIAPFDLIPDFLVGIGLLDDGVILGWVIKKVTSSITPEIKAQAEAQVKKILGHQS